MHFFRLWARRGRALKSLPVTIMTGILGPSAFGARAIWPSIPEHPSVGFIISRNWLLVSRIPVLDCMYHSSRNCRDSRVRIQLKPLESKDEHGSDRLRFLVEALHILPQASIGLAVRWTKGQCHCELELDSRKHIPTLRTERAPAFLLHLLMAPTRGRRLEVDVKTSTSRWRQGRANRGGPRALGVLGHRCH